MIGSFDELFRTRQDNTIPDDILEALSAQVAPHYTYVVNGGACMLQPVDGSSFTLTGEGPHFFVVDNHDVVFKTDEYETALTYSQNALLPLGISFDRWTTTLDGDEYDGMLLVRRPLNDEAPAMLVAPRPTPLETNIPIEANGRSLNMHFVQTPNRSETVRCFSSDDEGPLTVSYKIDLVSQTVTVSMSLSRERASSATQYYRAAQLYYGCAEGTGSIAGATLGDVSAMDVDHSHQTLETWRMAAELESALKVTFSPSANLEFEDLNTLYRLYCTIVLDKAVWLRNVRSWTLPEKPRDGEPPYSLSALISCNEHVNLLGVSLDLYGYTKLVDAMVEEVEPLQDGSVQLRFTESDAPLHNYAEVLLGREPLPEFEPSPEKIDALFADIRTVGELLAEQRKQS